MKLVKIDGTPAENAPYNELVSILEKDGIICFPAESNYRLGAAATSVKAVNNLIAAKRRSSHAPSLVFVSGAEMLADVADQVPEIGLRLAESFWPGPLTLLVKPGDIFPKKVRKIIAKATGMIGVRIPGHPVARSIVEQFGGPLLISSANLAKKSGATSPAQVKKNFGRQIELMVDQGDLPQNSPSTLVGLEGETVQIRRLGAVSEEEIRSIAEVSVS